MATWDVIGIRFIVPLISIGSRKRELLHRVRELRQHCNDYFDLLRQLKANCNVDPGNPVTWTQLTPRFLLAYPAGHVGERQVF